MNDFDKNGYVITKGFIDSQACAEIQSLIKSSPPVVFEQFSSTPLARGWGNLISDERITKLIKLKDINELANNLAGTNTICNHLLVNNKPRWVGRDVEFHQEIFNRNTFAAGASLERVKKEWIQVYIPLVDEDEMNGGLCIFENSHNFGELEHEDIYDGNGRHKRRVKAEDLDSLEKRGCKLKCLKLKAGDLLCFSTFLVHASANNLRGDDRMSAVVQYMPDNFIADQEIYDKEIEYRSKYIKEHLQTRLDAEHKDKDKYKDVGMKK